MCNVTLPCFQWYKDLISLLSCRMEITGTPPHVTAFQCFNTESAMTACKRYLPECALDSAPDELWHYKEAVPLIHCELQKTGGWAVCLAVSACDAAAC